MFAGAAKTTPGSSCRMTQAVAKEVVADAVSAGTVSPDTPNVLEAMVQLEEARTRSKSGNKLALDTEKEKDTAEQEVQRLQQLLQVKRPRTHDTSLVL